MKRVLLIALLMTGCALMIPAETFKESIEAISYNWYHVGFTCGQENILKVEGHPIEGMELTCSKWNAKFSKAAR